MRAASTGAVERRSKPRWFQFSLRLLLIFVAVCAVLLGLVMWRVRRREQAVEAVKELGGRVILGSDAPLPEWLLRVVPSRVVVVDLADTPTTNAGLARLENLTALRTLKLDNTNIGPGALPHLEGLAALESLSLAGTGIGDADLVHLARLRGLTMLDLRGTEVTDAGLEHLRELTALGNLDLRGTKVTGAGLQHLSGLSGLKQLWLDDGQITRAGIQHLERIPRLQRLLICVPRGTGKEAWELLQSLPRVESFGLLPPEGPGIWTGAGPWQTSPAGVAEAILSKVELEAEEAAALLEVLADTHRFKWARKSPFPREPPPVLEEKDKIKTVEEFIQAVKDGGRGNLSFLRRWLYSRSDAAKGAVPALLQLLEDPDYEVRRRSAFILVRIGLDDQQVVAAIARMLNDDDPMLRAITAGTFDDTHAIYVYGDVGPTIGPQEAEVAVPLLVAVAQDEHLWVINAVIDALGGIAHNNPEQAEAVVPLLLRMLRDKEFSVSSSAVRALDRACRASPEDAKATVSVLCDMLRDEDTPARAKGHAVKTLGLLVRHLPQEAAATAPLLLHIVREKSGGGEAYYAPEALGHVVEGDPETLKAIIPPLVEMVQDADEPTRRAAVNALGHIADRIYAQARESPASP